MIGIYKIVSPSRKVYIGQSTNIERRKRSYEKYTCENQTKLHRSLLKYGFSEHIFEVIEECKVEELNVRERHWQDFYDVLKKGLNLRLTGTEDKSGYSSEESKKSISRSHKLLNSTVEGKDARKKAVASTDQKARVKNTDYKIRTANMDYSLFQERKVSNTDYAAFQEKRIANTDFKVRSANTDYGAIAEKLHIPVTQRSKDGTYIKEWNSATQASTTIKVSRGDISNCCRGRQKTAGGFIWKYVT